MLIEVAHADEEDELEFRVEDSLSNLELYSNNIDELLLRLVIARLISESTDSQIESYALYRAMIVENSANPAEQLVEVLKSIIRGCLNALESDKGGETNV